MGQLKALDGVKLEEIGTITQVNSRNNGPALLFDSIPGYRKGYRILTNALNNSSLLAITFGLNPSLNTEKLVEWLKGRSIMWLEKCIRYEPSYVSDGPILENIESGADVDLTKFPVPKWHPDDAGPYIGTGCAVITKDPDNNWINLGTYRSQLFSKNEVGLYISPGKHGKIMEEKYFRSGKKMPVVLVYGMDPLTFLVSSTEIPYGVSELNYIGAIRGRSVPVVKGRATNLPIPAYSEIAVEGFIEPDKMREEGPFGEWTGYYASGQRLEPYIEVVNSYYRDEPILLGFPPSKGSYSSYGYFRSVYRSALIRNQLERLGLPGVKGVWAPEVGGSRMLLIVSIKQLYPGHATEAALLASQLRESAYASRFVIVVDDDINPYDIEDVLWAVCTRTNPAEDVDIIRKTWSSPLDPRIRKPTDDYTSSLAIIKAVKPYNWINEFPKTAVQNEEKRKEIFEKYKDLLHWTSW